MKYAVILFVGKEFVFHAAHRLAGYKQIVQPAGAGQAGFVGGIQYAPRFDEKLFGVFYGEILQKSLGANPRPPAKQPLERVFAQANAIGNSL